MSRRKRRLEDLSHTVTGFAGALAASDSPVTFSLDNYETEGIVFGERFSVDTVVSLWYTKVMMHGGQQRGANGWWRSQNIGERPTPSHAA